MTEKGSKKKSHNMFEISLVVTFHRAIRSFISLFFGRVQCDRQNMHIACCWLLFVWLLVWQRMRLVLLNMHLSFSRFFINANASCSFSHSDSIGLSSSERDEHQQQQHYRCCVVVKDLFFSSDEEKNNRIKLIKLFKTAHIFLCASHVKWETN